MKAFLVEMATQVVVASNVLAEEAIEGCGLGKSLVIELADLVPVEVVHNCNQLDNDRLMCSRRGSGSRGTP